MEAYTAIMMTVAAVSVISVLFLMVLLRTLAREREAEPGPEAESAPAPAAAAVSDQRLSGTLIILLFYLVVVVGLWGSIYLTMLRRG